MRHILKIVVNLTVSEKTDNVTKTVIMNHVTSKMTESLAYVDFPNRLTYLWKENCVIFELSDILKKENIMKTFNFILFIILTFFLFAETHIPAGNISGIWNYENSPYFIDGEVTIPANDLLTIESGVEIIFSGCYKFIVYGRLLAEGTAADTIRFSAENSANGWKGLRFINTTVNGQDSSKVIYCKFQDGNATEGGSADVRGGALACYSSSDVLIDNCLFSDNIANYGGAIAIYDSDILLKNSIVRNNEGTHDAGGILIRNNSAAILENVSVIGNRCFYDGGGIYCCTNASPVLNNVTIANNFAVQGYDASGGGISCWNANVVMNNVTITNNFSEDDGGGIEIILESNITMNNVSISRNTSRSGGGIYISGSTVSLSGVSVFYNTSHYSGGGIYVVSYSEQETNITFDSSFRSNIYLNNSMGNENRANDIYSNCELDVIVDTFTVLEPTEHYTYPLENFTFDILHARITFAESDLYVSPSGSDANSGLTPNDPLRTIYQALHMISPENQQELHIYLAEGTYSPSLTGEYYPLEGANYVSIIGESQNTTILDAEETGKIFNCLEINGFAIENMTIKNGNHGAMLCSETGISIENVTLTNNHSNSRGGAIYFSDCPNPILTNVTIKENMSRYEGGGLYFNESDPQLSGVNIFENISLENSGGGLSFYNSTPFFDSENRCNIYLNDSPINGNDISANTNIAVIVDTFTVLNPNDYYAHPIENFTFDIWHSKIQNINADIYVSPSGSDENSGLTPADPLLTISKAYQLIFADQENPHSIFLANGIYSPSHTGETYPLDCTGFVTLTGTDRDLTILDAEGTSYLLNCRYSDSSIQNLTVKNGNAGGIFLEAENISLNNLNIYDNYNPNSGGGIFCNNCNPVLTDVIARNNFAEYGGGVYFINSEPILSGVSIFENSASNSGGGLYLDNSIPVFDSENRCNLYLNNSENFGKDICTVTANIDVVVDTFTVMIPDNFFAYPVDDFTFDIMHSVVEQADQDLYVSPNGSDENSGLTAEDPLKTINFAMSKIVSNEENPHTIHLAAGVYSTSETGENFPLIMKRFISIMGEDSETTFLDGEELRQIIESVIPGNNFSIQRLSIINGFTVGDDFFQNGGGIFCFSADCHISDVKFQNNHATRGGGIYFMDGNLSLSNVIIENNYAEYEGAGICCSGNCSAENSIIRSNHAGENAGGLYFSWSNVTLDSVTISENISESEGGGIYFSNSNATLNSVSITGNTAEHYGGGIYLLNSEPTFNSENRSSIYLNSTGSRYAKDIYYYGDNDINVIIDTFSIDEPTPIYVYPTDHFTFDIQNHIDELLNVDVYVSPNGSDNNDGISPENPFQSIYYALCSIKTDENNPVNIYLAAGEYYLEYVFYHISLPGKSFTNIIGENPLTTIISGEDHYGIFYLENITDFSLQNVGLKHGHSDVFYATNSDITLKNMAFSDNIEAETILQTLWSNVTLDRVIFHNNSTLNSVVYSRSNSHLKVLNCTFASNEITNSGNNISLSNSNAEIINTICRNNSSNELGLYYGTSSMTVAYSDIQGGEDGISITGNNNTVNWLEGNIDADPLFEDEGNNNFRLQTDSPCIDAGIAFFEWNDEIIIDLSEDDYFGNAPDMGAFEYGMSFAEDMTNSYPPFFLKQNHPNPFRGSTEIYFVISRQDIKNAKIDIYNIKGQKVRTLECINRVDAKATESLSHITWDGKDETGKSVNSGIYFYKLSSGKQNSTKKMMLIR